MSIYHNQAQFSWEVEEEFCDLSNSELEEASDSELTLKIKDSFKENLKVNPLTKKGSMRKEDQERFLNEIQKFDVFFQGQKFNIGWSVKPNNEPERERSLSKNTNSESPKKVSSKSVYFTREIRTLLRDLSESKKKDPIIWEKIFIEFDEDDIHQTPSGYFPEWVITMNDVQSAI
jgi:hypothetical protein